MKTLPGLSGELLEDERRLLELPIGREVRDEAAPGLPEELMVEPPDGRTVDVLLPQLEVERGHAI